jgi:hypothetical protein
MIGRRGKGELGDEDEDKETERGGLFFRVQEI